MSTPLVLANDSAFIDLHAHSTASDGCRVPGDVIREARRAGLSAIALTDHDTLDGLREAALVSEEMGIRLVAGVELSAVEDASETHMLGLHLGNAEVLDSELAALRTMRRTRAEQIVQRLQDLGVRVTLAAVLEQAGTGVLGRPHIARALVAEGWATDFRDAFDRYIGGGRPAFVAKETLPVIRAIEMIHRAGGIAVMAHPGALGTEARLTALAEAGMDGVEVLHPSHTPDDVSRLDQLADRLSLVKSGGSDWHGTADQARALGSMRVPAHWLLRQDERARQRREQSRVA